MRVFPSWIVRVDKGALGAEVSFTRYVAILVKKLYSIDISIQLLHSRCKSNSRTYIAANIGHCGRILSRER